MPCREKYWEELSSEDKIDKIAHILEFLVDKNSELEKKIYKLENHNHDGLGRITIPLKDGDNCDWIRPNNSLNRSRGRK